MPGVVRNAGPGGYPTGMESRVRALGHPVHPMLVVFPLGLFVTAAVFDLIDVAGGPAAFGEAAFYNIGAGIVGAVLAAVTGLADWTRIPGGTRAKRIGLLHAIGNSTALVVFVIVFLYRWGQADDHRIGGGLLVVELLAVAVAGVAAWFGGELVDRLGIGVDDRAHADAPSSLSGRPARAR